MSDISYQTVVKELLSAIPAFRRTTSEWDADLPHEVLGALALHLCNGIRTDSEPELVQRAFQFLNRMAETQDEDVLNLLVVSVLEVVADDPVCCQACNENTTEKVRALIDRVSRGWPRGK